MVEGLGSSFLLPVEYRAGPATAGGDGLLIHFNRSLHSIGFGSLEPGPIMLQGNCALESGKGCLRVELQTQVEFKHGLPRPRV